MSGRYSKSHFLLALSCFSLLLAACATGVGTQAVDAGSCNDNNDCAPGTHCVGNICVSSAESYPLKQFSDYI